MEPQWVATIAERLQGVEGAVSKLVFVMGIMGLTMSLIGAGLIAKLQAIEEHLRKRWPTELPDEVKRAR